MTPRPANDVLFPLPPMLRLATPFCAPLHATLYDDGRVLCGRVEFRSTEWLVDKRGNQVAPCGWMVGICRALVAAGLGRHALIVRTWDRRPVCTIDSIADVAA